MKVVLLAIAAGAALTLSACDKRAGETYTLYRNSPFDPTLRNHFATFDSDNSGNFNLDNCQMSARLLNANVIAHNDGKPASVGFWCEHGPFSESGRMPTSFEGKFPTDTP